VTNFPAMLARFAAAVEANDGAALAALFADDGVYEDGFYGAYTGARAIIGMVAHFHETGEDFRWEFFDPVSDGRSGYAHYRFSYRAKMAGAEGRPVAFEGIGHFTLRDGKIVRYCEVFDRGLALAQQGFAAERIKRVVEKAAARQNQAPEFRAHLQRFGER
jgi:ketosteroid isomerase-like protein